MFRGCLYRPIEHLLSMRKNSFFPDIVLLQKRFPAPVPAQLRPWVSKQNLADDSNAEQGADHFVVSDCFLRVSMVKKSLELKGVKGTS